MRHTIKRMRVSNRNRNKNHRTRYRNHSKRKRILRGGILKKGLLNVTQSDDKKELRWFEYDGDINTQTNSFDGAGTLKTYYFNKEDEKNKKGELVNTYAGGFKSGKPHGDGIKTSKSNIIIGTWVNGLIQGEGKQMLNPDFKRPGIVNYNIVGIWKDNLLISGTKTIDFVDGMRSVYVGPLNPNTTYHGVGKCSWYDADKTVVKHYDGNWDNGIMNGQGIMTTYKKDGDIDTVQEGIWFNNTFSPLQTATSKIVTTPQQNPFKLFPPPKSKLLPR